MKDQLKTNQLAARQLLNKELSNRLDKRRIALDVSKAEIARFCEVSAVTAANWFNGSVKPSLDNINKLAAILKSTPEYLQTGKSYTDSNKFVGIDPDIIGRAVKIVRQAEVFSGQMYSADDLGLRVVEVCYRLSNSDELIEVVPSNSLVMKAVKGFAEEFNELYSDVSIDSKAIDAMLNKACLAIAAKD